jgi:predicted dehydrogenase
MIFKVMVIGCGGIGSRHLQALGKINIPIRLWSIDPDENSLLNAKKLFYENSVNHNIQSIEFLKKFPKHVDNIDLCIIATSSNVRLDVLKELVSNYSIKNIIFEKILFQSEDQLYEAKNIIQQNKIKSWVNCFRREEEFWKKIKEHFVKNSNMKMYYAKSGCHVCTNSIHILDLATWLFNDQIKQIDGSNLDAEIYESRRKGFIELSGLLKVEFQNGSTCDYISKKGPAKEDAVIEIISDKIKLKIREIPEGKGFIWRKENDWKPEEQNFHILFQSEKTQKIAEKILLENHCNLTSFEESIEIHKPFLCCITNHLNKISNSKYDYCPIT